ncbi:MAG: hypothetical protein Q9191_006204 [Dirinaria sp. TL-2023a]
MLEVQDPIPELPTQKNHSGPNVLNEPNFTQSNAWDKCNLLSLDGGGIRGYWSLLVLRKLFQCIATEEQSLDKATADHHSFAPQSYPKNVSHLSTHEQRRGVDGAVIDNAIKYLPCHYFDLMCGSSTGALIAIMLGRFRMPVPDCLHEYRRLGEEVFGKPRVVHALRFKLGDRKKYSTARLEKVLQDVAERRCEEMEDHQRIDFPMPPGLCKVVVTTLKDTEKSVGKPYLLRTYDHEQPSTPILTADQPRPRGSHPNHSITNRSATLQVGGHGHPRVNYGKAHQFEVMEVARAATAAKFYFEPFERKTRQSGKYVRFTDGGFSLLNNPTKEGIREIRSLNEHNKVNIVVSVGTARSTRSDIKKCKIFSLRDAAYHLAHKTTDPEVIHNDMTEESTEGNIFHYYRLNDSDGLDIPLDEWKPKRSFFIPEKDAGSKTIKKIENAFNRWLANGNFEDLQNCAKKLVECRRERMDTPQWERYATGCTYTCRAPNCRTQSFLHLDAFRSHVRDCHREMTHPEDRATEWRKQWEYQAGNQQ